MKNKDVLFCRKNVVNNASETVAYYLLHPDSTAEKQENCFLSSLFVDLDLNEVIQGKTLFFQIDINKLTTLPIRSEIPMVIFLDGNTLIENNFELLSEIRTQGYQLGIINPTVDAFSSFFLDLFTYTLFSLDSLTINEIIERCKNPLFSQKKQWINKIEHAEQFKLLKEVIPSGLFCGNFIKRMTEVKGTRIIAYKSILIDLMTALKTHESSPQVLADIIERDPTLTYRIIKLTHTSQYYSRFNVSTAQRAVEIIGIQDLIKWVGLVMLSSVSGKPACLFTMAISRAYFCENLSKALFPKLEGAFLVGLFSYLPSFFDDELPELLKDLPLGSNITGALLEHSGNLGGVLKVVEAYEAGRWDKIPFEQLISKDINEQTLKTFYINSLKAAREMSAT